MYLWRGFPMVAVAADDGKGRVVHLGKSTRATLCGLPATKVLDEKVATGWPDCETCIEYTRFLLNP